MPDTFKYLPGLGYCRKEGDTWLLMIPGREPEPIPASELYRAWLKSSGNPRLAALFDYPGEAAICVSGTENVNIGIGATQTMMTLPCRVTEMLIFRSLAVWNQLPTGQLIHEIAANLLTQLEWNGSKVIPDMGGWTGFDSAGISILEIFYGQGDLVCTVTNNTAAAMYTGVTWSAWLLSRLEFDQ